MKIIKIVTYDCDARELVDQLQKLCDDGVIDFHSVELTEENY